MFSLLSVTVALFICAFATLWVFRRKYLKFVPIIPSNSMLGYTYPIIPSNEGDGHARMLEIAEKYG